MDARLETWRKRLGDLGKRLPLRDHCPAHLLEAPAFFKRYQILRNVWLAARDASSSVLFLLPRANSALSVKGWAGCIGLDQSRYGTHSLRRTKATLIYKRTKNIRAIQLLLGHTKLESTVRYLGIEVDDALEISEQTEI